MRDDVWIDLTDPDAAALKAAIPVELHRTAFQRILAAPRHDDDPRPRLEAHGDYLFGVLVVFHMTARKGDRARNKRFC